MDLIDDLLEELLDSISINDIQSYIRIRQAREYRAAQKESAEHIVKELKEKFPNREIYSYFDISCDLFLPPSRRQLPYKDYIDKVINETPDKILVIRECGYCSSGFFLSYRFYNQDEIKIRN